MMPKVLFKITILEPPVRRNAIPRNMFIVAIVVINALTLTLVIKKPLIAPQIAPVAMQAAIASNKPNMSFGSSGIRIANTMLLNATIDPKEISICPDTIISVIDVAATPITAAYCPTLRKLRTVRKCGDAEENTIITMIYAIRMDIKSTDLK